MIATEFFTLVINTNDSNPYEISRLGTGFAHIGDSVSPILFPMIRNQIRPTLVIRDNPYFIWINIAKIRPKNYFK